VIVCDFKGRSGLSYPAQVADGTRNRRLESAVVPAIDVFLEVDVAFGVCELDDVPRCLKSARRAGSHASKRCAHLGEHTRFRQLGLKADVADLSRAQKPDETSPDVGG
jgi:hypothetical protein